MGEEEVAAAAGVHDADDVEEEMLEQRDDEENNNNAADGESGMITTETTSNNNTDLVKLITKDPSCAAHSMCAILVGDCCPSKEGIILDCCYGIPPDQEEDVVKVVEGNDN